MKGNTMTKKTDMTFEELNNKIDSLLANTNKKMTDLIDQYNDTCNEDEDHIDTVDLDYKFDELSDYIYDYSQ